MAEADLKQADELLQQLLALPPDQRSDHLQRSCGDNPALKALVDRLLRQATEGEDDPRFREGGGAELLGVETADFAPPLEAPRIGETVGPFRLLEVLGRGGMATVYLAERADGQFEQRVALKVLERVGETRARFEQERQILASLNHPHIAHLIDGGVTDHGVPYVAMEYVVGAPLLEYCDDRRLSIAERLRLFATVVDAVDYAHRNLILHRDIKSSNVIVANDGVAKLLDFGIAKLLEPDAMSHAAPVTRAAVPLTPEYASPEQIRGDAMTVAVDVYQLGYLLYLLLVGKAPYLTRAGDVADLIDAITHREAIPPSACVAQFSAEDDEVSASRGTSSARLRRQLSGDLDRVVLKALAKDPGERYSSASQLAADVLNVLNDEPVTARPASAVYRIGKFVKRHRAGVAAASLVLAAALTATTVFTYRLAVEKERATLAAAQANEVSDFLVGLVELSEPERSLGRDITVREVLDRAANRVGTGLERQPQMQMTLHTVLGQMYRELGAYDDSEAMLDAALEAQTNQDTGAVPDAAAIRLERVELYIYQGRYEDAVTESDFVLSVLDENDDAHHAHLVRTLRSRGQALREMGELDAARETLRQARSLRLYGLPTDERLGATIDLSLGNVEYDASNFDEARQHYLQARDRLLAEGSTPNLTLAHAHLRLGYVAFQLGELDAAEAQARESLNMYERIYSSDHPDMHAPISTLSAVHSSRGEFEEAERLLNRQLESVIEFLGSGHPTVATIVSNRGTLLFRQGRHAEAAESYRQAAEIERVALGPMTPGRGRSLSYEAYALFLDGDPSAEARFLEALEILEAAYEPGHTSIANVNHDLGRLYVQNERYATAEQHLRRALDARTEIYGEDSVRVAASKLYLGAALAGAGQLEDAEVLIEEARAWLTNRHGEDSLELAHANLWLADYLHRTGRSAEAKELFEGARSKIQSQHPADHWLSRLAARLEPRFAR